MTITRAEYERREAAKAAKAAKAKNLRRKRGNRVSNRANRQIAIAEREKLKRDHKGRKAPEAPRQSMSQVQNGPGAVCRIVGVRDEPGSLAV